MNIILFSSLLVFTLAYSLWRGDRDARIAAMICVMATLFTHVLMSTRLQPYQSVERGVLMIDVATLTAFIGLALVSSRFWPLWIAGLQLTASSSHLIKLIDESLVPLAYAVAERFWGYPILLIIAIGAYRAHRRERRAMARLSKA